MIVSNIQDVNRYRKISPAISKAIDYIQSGKWKNLPIDKKRYPIHEGEVEAMRLSYEPSEQGTWESHQDWIDIQMLVSGEEIIKFAPIYSLEKDGDFLMEKDFQKWLGSEIQTLVMKPEQLAFFFPEDGHMPNLCSTKQCIVDKVVIKVKVSL